MAKKITAGKSPQGARPKKGKPFSSGGPGFMGGKGTSKTVQRGSRAGGRKQTAR